MKDIKVAENQKTIIVCKELADKNHLYSIINLDALDLALVSLKNSEFKLWVYIAKNQNNYRFALSRADVCRKTGMSDKTYWTCVNSLIDKGYLVETEEHDNNYYFYEGGRPIVKEDDISITVPNDKINQQKNFVF